MVMERMGGVEATYHLKCLCILSLEGTDHLYTKQKDGAQDPPQVVLHILVPDRSQQCSLVIRAVGSVVVPPGSVVVPPGSVVVPTGSVVVPPGSVVVPPVKEFFSSGMMMGELNTTIISLVPKSKNPRKTSHYKPIACCSVVYKCISKELMNGYTWKYKIRRCAFKVDIQKAYGIVSWDFLKLTLDYFGFHSKWVNWIMVYLSTFLFSINVNGNSYGFLKAKRGLRQGDPVLPYLFTIIMEVQSHVKKTDFIR
ncbi:RNA-directed DNA polymerase, eukaryota, reverse transcriptase zinc-binding domain protein [Tanacetum coccineum]|uniref:RNA-directed DNA polymerase, eukaryota, reverse transcriptase zinc-binding domain protein n=1 Tax=Tanacetum coccineum TaxID=301880 RepID=A0ABQ5HSU7_9ASTR